MKYEQSDPYFTFSLKDVQLRKSITSRWMVEISTLGTEHRESLISSVPDGRLQSCKEMLSV